MDDFTKLMEEALADPEVRCAYKENGLRRKLAGEFDGARKLRGLSVRGLAKTIGTSASQVQRLLHHEVGGSLTLSTIIRAADALGLSVGMWTRPETYGTTPTVHFGTDWTSAIGGEVREQECRTPDEVAMTAHKTGGSDGRRRDGGAEEMAIVARARLVVAEICAETAAVADARIRKARKIADELRRLADSSRELQNGYRAVPDGMPFTKLRRLKSLRSIVHADDMMRDALGPFLREHGALVEDEVRKTLADFRTWADENANRLAAECEDFEKTYLESLRANRAELNELAQDWASVDADGQIG